jgi:bla regulator protein blaR1
VTASPTEVVTAAGQAIANACWQGTLAFGFVWLLFRLWPRIPARVQCWGWRLVYLKFLVALLGLPRIDLAWVPSKAATLGEELALITGATPPWPLLEAVHGPTTKIPPWSAICVILGFVGFLLFAARLIWAYQRTQAWLRGCEPCDQPLQDSMNELCERFHLRFQPRLLRSEELTSPILLGIWRPAIVLPSSLLESCTLSDLRLMLAHELAHLKRKDLAWNWLPFCLNGLFFFHPLIWLAYREWRLTQEVASDELAVRITNSSASAYGEVILRLGAAGPFPSDLALAALGAAGSFRNLKRRLLAMRYLDPVSGKKLLLAALIAGIIVIAVIVPWRLIHSQETPQVEDLGEEVVPAVVTIKGRDGKLVKEATTVTLKKVSVNGEEALAPRIDRPLKPGEKITIDLGEGKSIVEQPVPEQLLRRSQKKTQK